MKRMHLLLALIAALFISACGGGSTVTTQAGVVSAPTVTSFTPTSGMAGTAVTIIGTNFGTSNTVSFNGTTATVTAATITSITTTVPSGATSGSVSVTSAAGTSTSSANFSVIASSGSIPTVNSFSPTSGAVGTVVTITGTNFSTIFANNTVSFNGTLATVIAATTSSLSVTVPVGATTGTVSVTTAGGAASAGSFMQSAGGAVPFSFAGTLMGGAIQGTAISDLTTTVTTLAGTGAKGKLDGTGTAASFYSPISITTDGTNLYVIDLLNYEIRMIVIATGVVTTLAGPGVIGGPMDATGTAAGFGNPHGITTDGTNLYVTDASLNNIRKINIATRVVTTLAGSGIAGSVDGTGPAASFSYPYGITTDGTNLYVADRLNNRIRKVVIATGDVTTLATVVGALAITTEGTNLFVSSGSSISKISIANGAVTTMPLQGAAFMAPLSLTTDGFNLYFGDGTYQKIYKIDIATGTVSIVAGSGTLAAADGTGAMACFYFPYGITTDGSNLYVADTSNNNIRKISIPPPTVTSMSSNTGIAGTLVTITGTNFDTATAKTWVTFNGIQATVTAVTATSLSATVPSGATTGKVTITSTGGTAISAGDFTIGAPTITGMSPSTGFLGTVITISGTNFDINPANNTVRFNGASAAVTAVTVTSIVATVPSGASTGKVTVSTAGGTAISAGDVTLLMPPTVTGMSPSTGPPGTVVTITGTNFDTTKTISVWFGSGSTSATAASNNSITATVPMGSTSGNITVSTASGSSKLAGFISMGTTTISYQTAYNWEYSQLVASSRYTTVQMIAYSTAYANAIVAGSTEEVANTAGITAMNGGSTTSTATGGCNVPAIQRTWSRPSGGYINGVDVPYTNTYNSDCTFTGYNPIYNCNASGTYAISGNQLTRNFTVNDCGGLGSFTNPYSITNGIPVTLFAVGYNWQ